MFWRLIVLVSFIALAGMSCEGGISGGGGSSDGPRAAISVDPMFSLSDRASISISGKASIDNELPDKCRGINCDGVSYSCPVCTSGTTVTWNNKTTGQQGAARTWLQRGECSILLLGCKVYTAWEASVCLAPGKNDIVVQASGERKGEARESIAVTFDSTTASGHPGPPQLSTPLSYSEEITVKWRPNPVVDSVTGNTLYLAQEPWTQWHTGLLGADKITDLSCCKHTVEDLDNGVDYYFAVSASNCLGEGPTSEHMSAIPGIVPTNIAFTNAGYEVAIEDEAVIEVEVTDQVRYPIADLAIEWTSSDRTVAAIQADGNPTDEYGLARATLVPRQIGDVVIGARVAGTDIATADTWYIVEHDTPIDPNSMEWPAPPQLLYPVNNAVVQQNSAIDDCDDHETRGHGILIEFDWTDVTSPNGVAGYYIFVKNAGVSIPIVDTFVTESHYRYVSCNVFTSGLTGWEWYVQAQDTEGVIGGRSETGVYQYAPCRLDDGTPCSTSQ